MMVFITEQILSKKKMFYEKNKIKKTSLKDKFFYKCPYCDVWKLWYYTQFSDLE